MPIPADLLRKLSADERTFLVLLEENGSLKTSEIAHLMSKAPGRVSGLIAQLRRKLHAARVSPFVAEALPTGETLYRYTGAGG